MDRSEAQRLVEAHLGDLMAALGLSDWRLLVEYDPIESRDPGPKDHPDWRAVARCTVNPEYQRARIQFDPAVTPDADELLESLRHELFHVVLAPYRLYRRWVASLIKAGSAVDEQEGTLWQHVDEQAVRALERMWEGLERYWRGRIAGEQKAEAKARRAMPLSKGYSRKSIGKNIKRLEAEGKKPAQAKAIALDTARKAPKRKPKKSK